MSLVYLKKTLLHAAMLVLVLVLVVSGAVAWVWADKSAPRDVTVTYAYNPVRDEWIQTREAVRVEANVDGTMPRPQNTLIIRVNQNDPVKMILISETLVINGVSEPLFEIAGHDSLGTGELHIAELVFLKVDAREFKADQNIHIQKMTLEDVVADDTELDIDVDVVSVVRVNRGGASSLFIGAGRKYIQEIADAMVENDSDAIENRADMGIASTEAGLRVDRIRILGPDSGEGHIEKLYVYRVGVDGRIELRDLEINEFILKHVKLEDS